MYVPYRYISCKFHEMKLSVTCEVTTLEYHSYTATSLYVTYVSQLSFVLAISESKPYLMKCWQFFWCLHELVQLYQVFKNSCMCSVQEHTVYTESWYCKLGNVFHFCVGGEYLTHESLSTVDQRSPNMLINMVASHAGLRLERLCIASVF